MQDQHEHVLLAGAVAPSGAPSDSPAGQSDGSANGRADAEPDRPAMVAVALGEGFASIFRSLGVSTIVNGGQTMNPSTEEILRAVQEAPSRQVLLLPNNANVLLAAKQARLLTDKELVVVSTRDMAQGLAAALAYQPDLSLAANAQAMDRALRSVRTGEVTTAVRPARLDGLEIRPGEALGLVGGQLAAAGSDLGEVVEKMLAKMEAERAQVVSLYYGAEVDAGQAQALAASLRSRYPNAQVEVLSGGQPLYRYVISVE